MLERFVVDAKGMHPSIESMDSGNTMDVMLDHDEKCSGVSFNLPKEINSEEQRYVRLP